MHVGNLGGLQRDSRIGTVRIDTLDHSGIYNKEMGKYHKLRVLKSILD